MGIDRRNFLKLSAGAGGAAVFASACSSDSGSASHGSGADGQLHPLLEGIVPIQDDERRARIEKARRLMVESNIDAIYMEGGQSMFYFTGVKWGLSERTFSVVIPARGDLGYICPAFEEDRARELIRFGDDVRTWEEHESPYNRIAQLLDDRGLRNATIGMEEQVRFFQLDGIRKEAPGLSFVSADPVALECRLLKSPAEIALMQRAADIDIAAYKATIPKIELGMVREDIIELSKQAFDDMGVEGIIGFHIDFASSQPHGSTRVIRVREGSTILMDSGNKNWLKATRPIGVDGYRSDISRTIFFGEPSQKQKDVWNHMKLAQTAAFEAAQVDVPCEDVDAAARRSLEANGYGPGYETPGCPHRTGHGIGLGGHEGTVHLTKGNKRPLEVGMCFSNEPMIVIPNEFGVRIEDCIHITDDGAQFFSEPQPSYDQAW